MEWLYNACGTYCIYKGYIIINQEHPGLTKYAIYKEDAKLSLIFQGVASTMILSKQAINELIENDNRRRLGKGTSEGSDVSGRVSTGS